jgi:hypothetical protein
VLAAVIARGIFTMHIDGQCHCGRVTYQAEIDPERVSICHCTDCQTLTGSPYRVTVICSGDQIRITGKPPKTYAKAGDNGRTRVEHFCPDCGSRPSEYSMPAQVAATCVAGRRGAKQAARAVSSAG